MCYLVGIFRTSSPGDSISGDPERTILRRWKGGVRLYRNLQQGIGSLKIKILLSIREKQISQVKKFSHFLYVWKNTSIWAYCISAIWGQHPTVWIFTFLVPCPP